MADSVSQKDTVALKTDFYDEPTAQGCCSMPNLENIRNSLASKLNIEKPVIRNFLAEFLGTAFLVCLGDGSIAQVVLSRKDPNPAGDFFTINMAFAFAIAFGVYVSGSVSGGHINPAVTLVMAVAGNTPWIMLPIYWAGQYLGAIFGAAVVFWVYHAAIHNFDGGNHTVYGPNATAGIFATYPQPFVSTWDGIIDQLVGTAILLIIVFAVTDKNNIHVPPHYTPLIIGFGVGLIGMAFGYNAGFAVNPARDLGPRIFTWIAGYGWDVFSYRSYSWFWVPILGPHIGAFVGFAFYKLCVGLHFPKRHDITDVQHEDEQIRLTKRIPE